MFLDITEGGECLYCTVSKAAIMAVTGIIPIHLLALEKAEVEQTRKNGSDLETVGQKKGFECIAERVGCGCGRTLDSQADPDDRNLERQEARANKFSLDAALVGGHGCFNEYLLRFKKGNHAYTVTIHHQHSVEPDMDITPAEGMVDAMLQSKSKWIAVASLIAAVMGIRSKRMSLKCRQQGDQN